MQQERSNLITCGDCEHVGTARHIFNLCHANICGSEGFEASSGFGRWLESEGKKIGQKGIEKEKKLDYVKSERFILG